MPGGLADLLDVTGAHALLHAGGPDPLRGLLAQEVGLERHHAGVDEQQVRVVVDQRRGGHDGVAVLLEERQPATPDLSGFHGESVLGCFGLPPGTGTRHRMPVRAGGRAGSGVVGQVGGGAPAPTELARRWGRAAAPAPPRASGSDRGRRRPARMPGSRRRARGLRSQPASTSRSGVCAHAACRGARLVASVSTATSTASRSSASRRAEASLNVRDEALGDRQLPQAVAHPDRDGGQQHGAAPHDSSFLLSPRTAVRTP